MAVAFSAPTPLRGLRLAVTIPPRTWFGGIDYFFALDMAEELRRMGAATLPVDLTGICDKDPASIRASIEAIRAFQPDIAVGLPNAGYISACKTPDGENLFRDILQIPSILIWDHGVLQFAPLLLGPLPADPDQSTDGCIRKMRAELDHPLFIHYSPDRGHVRAMDALGILESRKVHSFLQPAWPAYVRNAQQAAPRAATGDSQLAFAGNVYLDAASKLAFRSWPLLAAIEERMLRARQADITAPLWELLKNEIEAIDPVYRAANRLRPDQSFYWSFMTAEIETVGTTQARLHALSSLRAPCDFYGNFCEPHMAATLESQFGLRFRGCVNCVTGLPDLYRNSGLMIDVVHPGYISGTSPKITACFAAGGCVVFDYKDDFHAAIGDLGDAVMYRSVDQMNELVDTYLSQPEKKRRIAAELQDRVLREFTFHSLWERILDTEPVWRESRLSQTVAGA